MRYNIFHKKLDVQSKLYLKAKFVGSYRNLLINRNILSVNDQRALTLVTDIIGSVTTEIEAPK